MRNNTNSNEEDEYICPNCGNMLADLNSYCVHCQRIGHMERKRKYLIQNDPKLSRLDSVCQSLNVHRRIFLVLFLIVLGLYGVNRYTGLMASLCSGIEMLLIAFFILFSICSILYFCLDMTLTRLSERKLQLEGDYYI